MAPTVRHRAHHPEEAGPVVVVRTHLLNLLHQLRPLAVPHQVVLPRTADVMPRNNPDYRSISLVSRMRLDVVPQSKIGVHGFLDSVIHHPQPSRCWLLLLCHAQQIAGLHNDLQRIA